MVDDNVGGVVSSVEETVRQNPHSLHTTRVAFDSTIIYSPSRQSVMNSNSKGIRSRLQFGRSPDASSESSLLIDESEKRNRPFDGVPHVDRIR